MADQFSEELVANMKEVFIMFDRKGNGCITPQDLGTVMRSLGLNPTEDELFEFISEVVPVKGEVDIDFAEFLTFMGRSLKNLIEVEELREAFRMFDKEGTGYVSCKELVYLMSYFGEPLSSIEIEEMMIDAEVDDAGNVNYEDFVTLMTSK